MREFSYIAKNKDGEAITGIVEAETDAAAAKLLMSKALVPVDIVIKKQGKGLNFFGRVSAKDKSLFARQLATMINAGLPISQALGTLKEQATNAKLKEIAETVSKDVEGGSQLSAALAKYPSVFKSLDISLISTGELSGSLDKTLLRLADQTEKTYRMNKKIRGAFTYPAFILVVVVVVVCIMIVYVMPQMESLYSGFNAKLPFLTRMMIGVSHALTSFGLFIGIGFMGLVLLFLSWIKKPSGRMFWDSFKLKSPVFGMFLQKVYVARFARTLSGLVSSGVPLLDGLKILSEAIGNVVYRDIILEAAEKVKGGVPLSTPLKESQHFPLLVSQMISVGEKTGELDNMLNNLADYYEEEVDNLVKNFSSLIEPVIIVIMGLLVGTILLAIMMPIYGLSKVIFNN